MRIRTRIAAIGLAPLLAAVTAGCVASPVETGALSGSATSSESVSVQSVQASAKTGANASDDSGETASSGSATDIVLSGATATVSGAGASVSGSTVTITQGGTYRLSGTFTGSVVVSASSSDLVELTLDGVEITADQNAAIYCSQADQLTITLAEGSSNSVSDAANYTYADAGAEEPDAAIFSKDDLTIRGTGSLTVNASFNNGIGTKDDLVIESGTLDITAANHGIRGRDSVTVLDGGLTIQSGSDGIQSNNNEDAAKGWISLEGGAYSITAGNDAIQAETSLSVSGGTYALNTGGGSAATPADASGSYKGLKAGTDLTVSGGVFQLDCADDGLHANGNAAIHGGDLTIASGDDAIHADNDLTVDGSETKIDVTASYEGLEAQTMTLADGIINVAADDDGINVAGGNDSGEGGRFGRDQFANSAGSSDHWLKITGGSITVVAGRDGIDINGSSEMTGGDVNITAATQGEGNTIDSDGAFNRTGGTLTETGGNSGGFGGGGGGGRGGRGGMPPSQPE